MHCADKFCFSDEPLLQSDLKASFDSEQCFTSSPVPTSNRTSRPRFSYRYTRFPFHPSLISRPHLQMQQNELVPRVTGDERPESKTSKERLGKDIVLRRGLFTPRIHKIQPYIDFTITRSTNLHSIASAVKRVANCLFLSFYFE